MRRMLVALALVTLGACRGSGDGGTGRTVVPAPLPAALTEVAGTMWDGGIAVAGGMTADGAPSPLAQRWDPGSNRWEQLPDLPNALHHTTVAVLGDRLHVLGGYLRSDDGWLPTSDHWSLGPRDTGWTTEAALPVARGALAAAVIDGALVVVGGAHGRALGTVHLFDPVARRWAEGPSLRQPREHLAVTVADGRVYAIGGRTGGLGTNLRSVESWAPGERAWRAEPALAVPRSGIGAATIGEVPCVVGGEAPGGTVGEIECLLGGSWEIAGRLDSPRHGLAAVAIDGMLHVIAGGPEPGRFVSTTHEAITVET